MIIQKYIQAIYWPKIGFKKSFSRACCDGFFKMIGSKISKHNIVILKIEFNFKLTAYENDLLVYKCVIKNILFPIKIILMDLEIKKKQLQSVVNLHVNL